MKSSPFVLVTAMMVSACAITTPQMATQHDRNPPAFVGSGEGQIELNRYDQESETIAQKMSLLQRSYKYRAGEDAKILGAIYVPPTKNEIESPHDFALDFGTPSDVAMFLASELLEMTTFVVNERFELVPGHPCGQWLTTGPSGQDAIPAFYLRTTVSDHDEFFSAQRDIAPLLQSGNFTGDFDLGAASKADSFFVSVGFGLCSSGTMVASKTEPVVVYEFRENAAIFVGDLNIGIFAIDRKEENFGLNLAKRLSMQSVMADVLLEGLPRAGFKPAATLADADPANRKKKILSVSRPPPAGSWPPEAPYGGKRKSGGPLAWLFDSLIFQ